MTINRKILLVSIITKLLLIASLTTLFLMLDYENYDLFRFIGLVLFIILGYTEYQKKNNILMILWFSFGLLINPFDKLNLDLEIWQILDIILITAIAISFLQKDYTERFFKLNSLQQITYLTLLIIWPLIGAYSMSFYKPRNIESYLNDGYVYSYAKRMAENAEINYTIWPTILIVTIIGFIFIIFNLNLKLKKA